ncbi:hypothetical protein [Cryptosporangium sp. NPDC048952]|uniref:hypothetical protein n=1 Tax=Cryptosporangium sp. NPDC048952 TaxID=3363961 RepID=UPI00371FF438
MSLTADMLPSRYEGAEERVPQSFDEFYGPTSGVVQLPNFLAWSGMTAFDVLVDVERVHMYQILIDVGRRIDVAKFMDAGLLQQDWPMLRRLLPKQMIVIWESRLPLASAV